MISRIRSCSWPVVLSRLLLGTVLSVGALAVASSARAADPDSEVKLVVILTRHGVRSPLMTNSKLGVYSAEAWPEWSVAPGILTPHGKQQMVLMGAYYRARYVDEGLLTGEAAADFPRIFFRADNDQRTIETALDLASGLVPGTKPDPHAIRPDVTDPLFRPAKVGIGLPDRTFAVSTVLGRVGGNPANITTAYQSVFATLQRVLNGGNGAPPAGKASLLDLPAQVLPGQSDHTVGFEGPLHVAEQIVDALILEYTEGLPMKDVGWGRMSSADLTQLIQLHSLYFDLTQGTFYPSQVQGSNFASHVLDTFRQAVTGQPEPGAFGAPGQKLIMVVGHDTNIVNYGGLLGLNWYLPGTQLNPVLPGGALVVELRQRRADHRLVVRTFYVSQTLDQTRNLDPLTLANPPAIAPIFVPGCSEATPGFDVPLDRFEAALRRVIDPKFVVPGTP